MTLAHQLGQLPLDGLRRVKVRESGHDLAAGHALALAHQPLTGVESGEPTGLACGQAGFQLAPLSAHPRTAVHSTRAAVTTTIQGIVA